MATFNKFDAFVLALASKKHNFGSDSLKVALTNSAPVGSTAAILSDITEISYTNLSARGLTTTSSSQTSGVYKLVIQDLTLTASGAVATFRYVVIYNDTASNKDLIAYFDYGSALTLASGETLTLDFDGTNGLLQLT